MKRGLWGVCGRPFLDLEPLLDLTALDAIDREITRGLARVATEYTGGTLKWMGVAAPWVMGDGFCDAMHALESMSDEDFLDFVKLGDDPSPVDLAARPGLTFGDETDRPFTRAQQRWLEMRHGVYFPWKVCYHFLHNDRWEDKHSGEGKDFTDEARAVFPETVAFLEALPFVEIGRAVLFGLQPNDHATLHRDTEPGRSLQVAQSMSFAPRPGKRFYLQNHPDDPPTVVTSRAYWFNDMDYHGVLPDPFFRYSVRVDGVFDPAFARALERHARRR